jgi:hypothetical protein
MKCLCQCADTGILFFEVALFASAKSSIRRHAALFAGSGPKKPQEAVSSHNQQQQHPGINPQ